MGTRVYTWAEVQSMPYPADDAAPLPERENRKGSAGFTPAQIAKCEDIQQASFANGDDNECVIGNGRFFQFPSMIAIMITPGLDVTNHEVYPDEIDGEPTVYIQLDAPKPL